MVGPSAFTQTPILDRLKKRAEQRAAQKAEDKVNQKVDQGIDKVIDGLFGAVEKSAKSTETKPTEDKNEKSATSTTTSKEPSEEDAMNMLSNILGGMNKATPPAASYSFNSSYDMKIKMTDKKGKANGFTYRYMFSNSSAYMGGKIIDADDPQMKSQMSSMEAIVFDFEKNSMYTFMNLNGQKQMMSIGFKDGLTGDIAKESYEKTTYTKTSQKKTIAGYATTGYEMLQDGEKYMIWISDKPISFISKYYEAFNKMSKANPSNGGVSMAYEIDSQLKTLMENGQMMLGMDSETGDGKMEMEVVKISPNDASTFATSGYSNMMDMSKMMQQSTKGTN
ncbi:hypothetical protein SAMN06298216_1126 [Spirosomataceae bacterium TFI 002]|nr:hypothetical protein SAMN06298216_1126 [Spirosomataceae bacterium TFI 002]